MNIQINMLVTVDILWEIKYRSVLVNGERSEVLLRSVLSLIMTRS